MKKLKGFYMLFIIALILCLPIINLISLNEKSPVQRTVYNEEKLMNVISFEDVNNNEDDNSVIDFQENVEEVIELNNDELSYEDEIVELTENVEISPIVSITEPMTEVLEVVDEEKSETFNNDEKVTEEVTLDNVNDYDEECNQIEYLLDAGEVIKDDNFVCDAYYYNEYIYLDENETELVPLGLCDLDDVCEEYFDIETPQLDTDCYFEQIENETENTYEELACDASCFEDEIREEGDVSNYDEVLDVETNYDNNEISAEIMSGEQYIEEDAIPAAIASAHSAKVSNDISSITNMITNIVSEDEIGDLNVIHLQDQGDIKQGIDIYEIKYTLPSENVDNSSNEEIVFYLAQ